MATKKAGSTSGSKIEAFKKLRDEARQEILAEIADLEKQIEEKKTEARELGFITESAPARGKRAVGARACKICGQLGHNSRTCPQREKASAAKS